MSYYNLGVAGHGELRNDSIHEPVKPQAVNDDKVDLGYFAIKLLASAALTITNTALTLSVSAMKLTRFTIIGSVVLGHLTRPLHACNKLLENHTFTPLKTWSKMLGNEHLKIMETEKVISVENKRVYFHPTHYVKSVKDSFKAVVAPFSLALSVVNATLWLVAKPLWLGVIPGIAADGILTIPIGLNKGIGSLTYTPLKNLSDWMFSHHIRYLDELFGLSK